MREAVYEIISSIQLLTGVGVCFYDRNHYFGKRYGDIEKVFRGHYCHYCNAMKSLPNGQKRCDENDHAHIMELIQMYREPFFNVCPAGVCEYIVPIYRENNLTAILFIGQCRIGDEGIYRRMQDYLYTSTQDAEMYEKLYRTLPLTTKEVLSSAGKLAHLAFLQLSDMTADVSLDKEPRRVTDLARQYIDYRYMNELSLDAIGDMLHVNPSYLSRTFKNTYGIRISDYIQTIRIEQAKKLLAFTKVPIAHISFNVGFTDPNYFSRVFHKLTGKTPMEYRKSPDWTDNQS